ncbi:hypothetical protein AB9F45_36815, partial [Rhizobium leguminosarum]
PEGDFTLKNIGDLFTPSIMSAYWIIIRVSVASALGGALIGFFLAWAVVLGGLPASVRSTLLTIGVETVLMEKLILGRRSEKNSPPCG